MKSIEVQVLEQALEKYEKGIDGVEFIEQFQKGVKTGMQRAIAAVKEAQEPLTVNSGKERELQYLTQIAEACGEGSYLHALLSQELVEWTAQMILHGVPPDVMINWAETQKEYQNMLSSSLELSTQVVESQNEVTRLEQLLKSRGEGYESALAEMVKSYDRELAEKSDRLVGMTNQWLAAEEQAEEAANLLVSLNIIARQQSTEILLLKAEVYDLTHQREN